MQLHNREENSEERELDFLMDQRQNREDQQFMIGRVDKKVTDKMREAAATKAATEAAVETEAERCNKIVEQHNTERAKFLDYENNNNVETDDTDTDMDFECTALPDESPTNQNRMSLENFISECDRYHISDRAACALATGLHR